MIKMNISALLLAAAIALTGCSSGRVSTEAESSAASQEQASSQLEAFSQDENPAPAPTPSPAPPVPEPEESESSEESSEESSTPREPIKLEDVPGISDEFVLSRMDRPMEEIRALDPTQVVWGPGANTDGKQPAEPLANQQKWGSLGAWFVAPTTEKIYLTFDEGYDAGYNEEILDTLKEKNVSAVFFVTLGFVQSRPDLVQRMIDEGHVVGNHTWKHIAFPKMDPMDCAKDLLYLHEYVRQNFGGYEMTLCRPPEGAFGEQSLALLQSLGYDAVLWSFAYRDWELDNQPDTGTALNTIVSRAHPGAIYLLHAVSSANASVLGDAIDQLQEQGYVFAKWDLS